MASTQGWVHLLFLFSFCVTSYSTRVCNNGGMGKMEAMMKLLGHADDATVDFVARSQIRIDPDRRRLLDLQEPLDRGGVRLGQPTSESDSHEHLEPFALEDVRLIVGSRQEQAQQTNLQYLLELDVDRLLYSFRLTAGLDAPGIPYGGWEAPQCELRGHFVGHYLSGCALMWASTHNSTLQAKMQYMVRALAECQDKIGTGYLSAFPTELFDRHEDLKPVWAPYYTIHKVMAGLLDQYLYAKDQLALRIVIRMADYFKQRVDSVIERFTINRHYDSLNEEVGGMNDLLYQLYRVTGKLDHLQLAHLFDKPCFLSPLALEMNQLPGLHVNTHLPLVIGGQSRYEVLGDRTYKDMSAFFLHEVQHSHMYSTGGTSAWEFWQDPHRLGDTLQQENQESCTTYNLLKVSRNLLRYTRDAKYADYYERAMVNGVLGIQRGTEPGRMIYMLPLGTGVSKAKGWHGWGTPYDSFWCCYGTGVESFSKLGDSIYFKDPAGSRPTLFIIQHVSSQVYWPEAGLNVTQIASQPTAANLVITATYTFDSSDPATPQAPPPSAQSPPVGSATKVLERSSDESVRHASKGEATIAIRVPAWADQHITSVKLNAVDLPNTKPASFFNLSREWQLDDKLEVSMSLKLHVERILDDRPEFSNLLAVLVGPYMLAGMTTAERRLTARVNLSEPTSWIRPIPDSHQAELRSLQLACPSPTGPLFVRHANGRLFVAPGAPEGSDEAAASTFRMTAPLDAPVSHWSLSASSRRMLQSPSRAGFDPFAASFESFDLPGQFLLHNGAGNPVWLVDRARSAMTGEAFNPFATFHQVPGLMGPGTISFEALNLPGHYLSTHGSVAVPGKGTPLLLQPLLAGDVTFAGCSSFIIGAPQAAYHPLSFVAEGLTQDFLLYPISAFKDESYTAYFQTAM